MMKKPVTFQGLRRTRDLFPVNFQTVATISNSVHPQGLKKLNERFRPTTVKIVRYTFSFSEKCRIDISQVMVNRTTSTLPTKNYYPVAFAIGNIDLLVRILVLANNHTRSIPIDQTPLPFKMIQKERLQPQVHPGIGKRTDKHLHWEHSREARSLIQGECKNISSFLRTCRSGEWQFEDGIARRSPANNFGAQPTAFTAFETLELIIYLAQRARVQKII
jgi:hypothetical protein